jgi:hypothetical protein
MIMNSTATAHNPCPRCDGQGDVLAARVNATGLNIFVCDECEAMWLAAEDVGRAGHVDFGTYMQGQGLAPLWSEITLLNGRGGAA